WLGWTRWSEAISGLFFCSLVGSSAIRAFISALKLRRCLDFISAPFPRQRFYTLLTGPNFGEHLTVPHENASAATNILALSFSLNGIVTCHLACFRFVSGPFLDIHCRVD